MQAVKVSNDHLVQDVHTVPGPGGVSCVEFSCDCLAIGAAAVGSGASAASRRAMGVPRGHLIEPMSGPCDHNTILVLHAVRRHLQLCKVSRHVRAAGKARSRADVFGVNDCCGLIR